MVGARLSRAMACVAATAVLTAAAGAKSKGTVSATWWTEHHDTRNSGLGDFLGPGDVQGYCKTTVVQDDSPNAARYFATGVLSETNEFLFTGNSQNIINIIEVETFDVININLTAAANVNRIANDVGIVSSGVNTPVQIFDPTPGLMVMTDRLYVGSGDGVLYALNIDYCTSQLAFNQAAEFLKRDDSLASLSSGSPAYAGRVYRVDKEGWRAKYGSQARRLTTKRARSMQATGTNEGSSTTVGAGVPCIDYTIAYAPYAVYAPPRFLAADPAHSGALPQGLVIVATTHPDLDAQGVIHGINGATGAELWNIPAVYNDTTGNQVTAGLRTVIAVDPTYMTSGNTVGYAAFGNSVVAFDLFSGVQYGAGNTTGIVNQGVGGVDNFVSSPTLSTDASTLYVHSSSGTLWRINIVGNLTTAPINFTVQWACDYYINQQSPVCDTIPQLRGTATGSDRRLVDVPVYDVDSGLVRGLKSVPRGQLVTGGFYQPTTVEDREQLHAAIRSLYAAHLGLSEGDVALTPVTTMTRSLPFEALATIVTPSGYSLLDSDGVPMVAKIRAQKAEGARVLTTTNTGRSHASGNKKGSAPAPRSLSMRPATVASAPSSPSGIRSVTVDPQRAARLSAVALSRPIPSAVGYGGIIPFATPSLSAGDSFLVISQYGSYGLDSAAFGVNPATGAQLWMFQNTSFPDGSMLVYGTSRSSPAIDSAGNIYLGADSDHSSYKLPVVVALYPNGSYNWLAEMGNDNVVIGAASPAVAMGYQGERRLYFVSGDSIDAIDEGYTCPGQLNPFTSCNGHGICNCTTGQCLCSDRCRSGPDCSIQNTCNGHGYCDSDSGGCVCDPCWSGPSCSIQKSCGGGVCDPNSGNCVCDTCHTGASCNNAVTCNGEGNCIVGYGCQCYPGYGPGGINNTCTACPPCSGGANCATPNTCGGHGTCSPTSGACTCNPGYDPASGCTTCDICHAGISSGCSIVIQTCSGHGPCIAAQGGCVCDTGYTGPDCAEFTAQRSRDTGGAIAAGILIPGAIIGIAAALYIWKLRNPLRPWSSLMPDWLSRATGVSNNPYSSVGWSTSSGGDAAASVPLQQRGATPTAATKIAGGGPSSKFGGSAYGT